MTDAAGARPNIILIVTDQQRYDSIRALGAPHADTPMLDRLVAEGTSFSRCYITAASCVPSRASLFNGLYPHTSGVLRNGANWGRTWVELLAGAGYHCVNFGKMHTAPLLAPAGFHERYNVENKDRYLDARWYFDEWDKALAANGLVKQQRELYRRREDYRERLGAFEWELPERLHSDNFVGDMAAWWINTRPKPEEPVFLQIGFVGPHPPYDPTPAALDPYRDRTMPVPVLDPDDLAGQPPPYRELRQHNVEVDHDSVAWSLDPTPEQLQRLWRHYFANVSMIDAKIGELLEALGRRGYLENAVVLFTSDHGELLGEHGHMQKWAMYESVVRVPLIAWSPGRVPAGVKRDGLCQLFDLGATILDLAGVPVPDHFEARSLRPALEGDAWAPRDAVFTEQAGDIVLTGASFQTMVRTERWKLVHFLHQTHGVLFDLAADPGERRNLWDDPAHAGVRRDLLDVIRDWRIESGYRTRDWAAAAR